MNNTAEVCNIATTGTYQIKGSGVGTIALTFNTASGDADSDYDCNANLSGKSIVQHMAFILESGGHSFDFQSADDFWTAPGSDYGGLLVDAQNPFVGSCKKQ